MKNVCIVLLLVVANAIPAWGQLFTPQQIDEIQEVYLSSSSTPATPPYGLPQQAQDVQQGDQNNTLRDTLLYKGETILIADSPLRFFPQLEEKVFVHKVELVPFRVLLAIQLDAERGYTAVWGIENDSLFLYHLFPHIPGNVMEEKSIILPQKELNRLVEVLSGQKFIDGKLFAGWVSGKIVGGANGIYLREKLSDRALNLMKEKKWSPEKILEYEYTGHYIYPEEYLFTVENGMVRKVDRQSK